MMKCFMGLCFGERSMRLIFVFFVANCVEGFEAMSRLYSGDTAPPSITEIALPSYMYMDSRQSSYTSPTVIQGPKSIGPSVSRSRSLDEKYFAPTHHNSLSKYKRSSSLSSIIEKGESSDDAAARWMDIFGFSVQSKAAASATLLQQSSSAQIAKSFVRKELSAKSATAAPEAVFMFDLDRCTVLGSDGNDLGIAMQCTNQTQATLTQLYSLLLNPCLPEAFAALRPRYSSVRVVLYTARALLLKLRPGATEMAVQWDPTMLDSAGQLYIRRETPDAATVMARSEGGLACLRDEEREVLQRALERLFATREAVRAALGLPAPPDIVVTAVPKDVARTAARLGLSAAHAHLWDDNEALRGRPGVIVVPPFLRLPPAHRRRLLAFLDATLPAPALPAELAAFMVGAHPLHRSLARGPTGRLEYRIPEGADPGRFGAQEPWPLPAPPAPPADAGLGRPAQDAGAEAAGRAPALREEAPGGTAVRCAA